jgi:hypothetical protein
MVRLTEELHIQWKPALIWGQGWPAVRLITPDCGASCLHGLVTAFASRGHPSSVYPGMNACFLLMSNVCCLLFVIRGLDKAVAEQVKNSSKSSPNIAYFVLTISGSHRVKWGITCEQRLCIVA